MYHAMLSRSVLFNFLPPHGQRNNGLQPMGILQARILEWIAVCFSKGFSQLKDWVQVSCIAGRLFTSWATREAQEYWSG